MTLDLGRHLTGGAHEITLAHAGSSIPYAIEAAWTRETPDVAPGAPLRLETALASDAAELGVPVRMDVRVTHTARQGVPSPIARVGLPAGVRLETRQLEQMVERGEIAFFETRPREITLYWEGLAAGEQRALGLDLIPEVPGTFTAPASSVYPYYDGERVSWAAGTKLRISP